MVDKKKGKKGHVLENRQNSESQPKQIWTLATWLFIIPVIDFLKMNFNKNIQDFKERFNPVKVLQFDHFEQVTLVEKLS